MTLPGYLFCGVTIAHINDGRFTVVDRASDVKESSVTSSAIVNVGSSTASTASEDGTTSAVVSITGGVFQMYRPLLGSGIKLEIIGGYFLSKYLLSDYYPATSYGYTKADSYTYLEVTYSGYYQVAHANFTLTVGSEDSYYPILAGEWPFAFSGTLAN